MTRRPTPRPRSASGTRQPPAATDRPLLAATLIVRNEAANLPGCLAGLRGTVDEVVVYDTGSTDTTRELATAAGARVLAGYWDDDFARARNAALEMTRAEWILVIDADERLDGDVAGLRAFLRGQVRATGPAGSVARSADIDLILLRVTNLVDGREADGLTSTRIARRSAVRWDGAVHEQLRPLRGGDGRKMILPADALRILHHGYDDPGIARAKAERNLGLAQSALGRLLAAGPPDPEVAARILLDLGRSALGAGRRQDAVDAFETLRELVPAGLYRAQATGLLAQLLLDEGGFDDVALVLEGELRDSGEAPSGYCDWLRAQALARMGDRGAALELVRGVDALVDPAGTVLPLSVVLVAHTVWATAAGNYPEAGDALLRAMLDHGGGAEHLGLLGQLWAGREAELRRRIDSHPGPYAPAVRAALSAPVG